MDLHGEYQGEHRSQPWRAEFAAIPRDVLAEFKRPNPARWFLCVLSEWATIVLTMFLARTIDHWAAYVLGTIFIGTRQHALVVLAHEGAHRLVSRKPSLNVWPANLFCFWPFFVDVGTYADFHLTHHRYLNTADDPEMKWRSYGAPTWDVPRSRARVALRFALDLVGLGTMEMIHVLIFTVPRTLPLMVGPLLLNAALVTLCLATHNAWILLMWAGAFVSGFSAVWRFRCLVDGHLASESCHRVHLNFWQQYLLAPHHIWVHWEHHHFPGIPAYKLLRLREHIKSVPVLSLHELFKHYETCRPVKTGTPIRDRSGALLVEL